MLLPESILKTYSNMAELAQIMQVHPTINGTPVKRTALLLSMYSTQREPMMAPNRRPSGNKEAIQDAWSCVTRNGGSSLVNNARYGEVQPIARPMLMASRVTKTQYFNDDGEFASFVSC